MKKRGVSWVGTWASGQGTGKDKWILGGITNGYDWASEKTDSFWSWKRNTSS